MNRAPKFTWRALRVAIALASAPLTGYAAQAPATPDGANAAAEDQSAFHILEQQAQYWTNRGRGDLAGEALKRILASDPDNRNALYQMGLLLVGEGDITSARTFESRLRRDEGGVDLATQLRREIDNAEVDRNLLNEARRRAADGDIQTALGLYQKLFAGREIGGRLAIEYYETLAGMDKSWGEAADGLRKYYSSQPSNGRVRLALAKVLSYREESRREALFHLSALMDDPAFHDEALAAMRDTLLWLDAGPADQKYYNRYLAAKQDEAVAEKLAQALNPKVIDAFTAARIDAFKSLNEGKLAEAEKKFKDLLAQHGNDAQSLGGLGLVKLRRQQFGAAASDLARAIRADASTRGSFGQALADARFWGGHARVIHDIQSKAYDDAAAAIAQLDPHGDDQRARVHVLEAKVAAARKNWSAAAEQSRAALSLKGDDDEAAAMLLDVLADQGRYTDLQHELTGFERKESSGAFKSRHARAAIRRAEARMAAHRQDWQNAAASYEQALAADPDDPWLRLEYARLLLNRNQHRQAEAAIASLSQSSSADAAHALALYYNDTGDWDRCLAVLEQVPAKAQTPDMRALHDLVTVKHRIGLALQRADMGDRSTAVNEMLSLQDDGTNVPEKTTLIADGLLKLGLNDQAALLVKRALGNGRRAKVSDLVQYARILGESGELSGAYKLITDLMIRQKELTAPERQTMADVYDDILMRASRRAIEDGRYQLALNYLEPIHRANPLNGPVLRYLGEVHQHMGQYDAALDYYKRAMAVDSQDLWAVEGAVGAALDKDDIETASKLLEVALDRFPENADIYTLISRTAHSANDLDTAIQAAEHAKRLRRDAGLPPVAPSSHPSSPAEPLPAIAPRNPFRAELDRAPADEPQRQLSLAAVHPRTSPVAAVAATARRARTPHAWNEGWHLVKVAETVPATGTRGAATAESQSKDWSALAKDGGDLGESIQAEIDSTRRAMASGTSAGTGSAPVTVSGLPGGLELATVEQLVQLLATQGKHDQVERIVLGALGDHSLDAASVQTLKGLLYPSAVELARQALARKDYDALIAHLTPVLDLPTATNDVAITTLMAQYSAGVGQRDKAAALFDRAVKMAPDDESLRVQAISLRLEMGDLSEANAIAVAGLEHNPDSARLHLLVGRIAKALGDLDSAMQQFLLANQAENSASTGSTAAPAVAAAPPATAPAYPAASLASADTPRRPPAAGLTYPHAPTSAPPASAARAEPARMETLDLDGQQWSPTDGSDQRVRAIALAAADTPPPSNSAPVDIRERLRNLGREGNATADRAPPPTRSVTVGSADSELERLKAEASPFLSQTLGMRYRSGEAGLSKLTEFRAPFSVDFNPYVGRLNLQVEPIYLSAGTFGDDPNRTRRYGTSRWWIRKAATHRATTPAVSASASATPPGR